jgi:hypothetical protein
MPTQSPPPLLRRTVRERLAAAIHWSCRREGHQPTRTPDGTACTICGTVWQHD